MVAWPEVCRMQLAGEGKVKIVKSPILLRSPLDGVFEFTKTPPSLKTLSEMGHTRRQYPTRVCRVFELLM